MVTADTTVWIDYFRGTITPQTEWLEREMNCQRLALLDLVLCEILQGIPDKAKFERVKRQLSKLQILTVGGEQTAIDSARNYQTLRSKGLTVRKTIDCLIATYCLNNGLALLHNDRDFDCFESVLGLRVVHPPKPSIH
jgi:predicted nucleic acid-binding protein